MKIKIRTNNRGIIGIVDTERKIYFTDRRQEHQFRIFNDGFGLSVNVIDFLLENDIEVVLVNFENRKKYWCYLTMFVTKGEKWTDCGDEQLILPLKFWRDNTEDVEIQTTL